MKRLLGILLMLLAICGLIPTRACAARSGDYDYIIRDDGVEIVLFHNAQATEILIPDMLDHWPVTSVGWGAFGSLPSLQSVTIPDSITSISGEAFFNCPALETVFIGSGVQEISGNPFEGCTALREIRLADDHAHLRLADGALLLQDRLVCYPAGREDTRYAVSEGITAIGSCAFSGAQALESIAIGPNVAEIHFSAFEDGSGSLMDITLEIARNPYAHKWARIYGVPCTYEPTLEERLTVRYNEAKALFDAGNWQDAREIFILLDFLDSDVQAQACTYAQAKDAFQKEDYSQARNLFASISSYADAETLFHECSSKLFVPGVKIRYGRWEQDNNLTNGSEPITWIVTDVKDDYVTLLSHDYLAYMPYHTVKKDITWGASSLRVWLDGMFASTAFTDMEKSMLVRQTVLPASENHAPAQDRIFLPSAKEMKKAVPLYGDEKPAIPPVLEAQKPALKQNWLRNSGKLSQSKAAVYKFSVGWSTAYQAGYDVTEKRLVQPAIYMKRESAEELFFNEKRWEEYTYQGACAAYARQQYAKALSLFDSISGYQPDGQGLQIDSTDSSVVLGTWEQDNKQSTGAEPIEWMILDEQDGHLLLLSRYVLDGHVFHKDSKGAEWAESSLHQWLNQDFFNGAFTAEEREKIKTSSAEKGAKDPLFVFSTEEAWQYLASGASSVGRVTIYSGRQYLQMNPEGNTFWWLRSTDSVGRTAYVDMKGQIVENGIGPSATLGVRPAMWIVADALPLVRNAEASNQARELNADIVRREIYEQAQQLCADNKFEKAVELFDLIAGYADSSSRAGQIHYDLAQEAISQKQYLNAAKHYASCGDFQDSVQRMKEAYYLAAEQYLTQNLMIYAIDKFELAAGYQDAQERADAIREKLAVKGLCVSQFSTTNELAEGNTGIIHHCWIRADQNGTYYITIDYTMPKGYSIVCFDPPNGKTFMYKASKKTDGKRGEVTFQIDNNKLVNAGVTINFVKSDKNRFFIFFTKDQIMSTANQLLAYIK